MNASEKAYNCHQKKILLAYISVKLKKKKKVLNLWGMHIMWNMTFLKVTLKNIKPNRINICRDEIFYFIFFSSFVSYLRERNSERIYRPLKNPRWYELCMNQVLLEKIAVSALQSTGNKMLETWDEVSILLTACSKDWKLCFSVEIR